MPINEMLAEAIFAGLVLMIGFLAIALAIRSWFTETYRARLNAWIACRIKADRFRKIKENSIIITLAVILIYPLGDATLHLLDDVIEDEGGVSKFEEIGIASRDEDRKLKAPVPPDAEWDWFRKYYNLNEGNPEILRFTRIGEIEAREDQDDRDTLDREKSYIHVLHIFFLLDLMATVALLVFLLGALVRYCVNKWKISHPDQTGQRQIEMAGKPQSEKSTATTAVPITETPPPTLMPLSVRVALAILLVAVGGILFWRLYEEHMEVEDKYERLVFRVWKNHQIEKEKLKEPEKEGSRGNRQAG